MREGEHLVLSQKFKGQKIYTHPYLSYIIVLDKIYRFFSAKIQSNNNNDKNNQYKISKSLRFMSVLVSMILTSHICL